MAPNIRVDQIQNYEGVEVSIQGWVYNRTHKGKLVFLLVRDGHGLVQCVAFRNDLDSELFDQLTRIPQESSIVVTGTVRADKRAPGVPGGFEIGIVDLEIVQFAAEDYPMALKEHGVDFALDNRHFWLRMPSQWAILVLQWTAIYYNPYRTNIPTSLFENWSPYKGISFLHLVYKTLLFTLTRIMLQCCYAF